ncbi:MAG: helix-turn-helix transcriptional regulator [Candidatus Nitronauta litoralis]|uniref:Helix-turn-helix transcriptional regulator n=1 Tax=Candidatus Nitronauta litoralis TaxID=2705533 RepID=A0A7T0G0S6_9BACT|nr:MAG: helix-turn-helix transcriptional regulator [Candidatus Nitronauta litoralis]
MSKKNNFGDWLRLERLKKRLSQRDLALKIKELGGKGHHQSIGRYEKGQSQPTIKTIQWIEKALNCKFNPTDDIVSPNMSNKDSRLEELSREEKELLLKLLLEDRDRDRQTIEEQKAEIAELKARLDTPTSNKKKHQQN